jgi:hypothetical protein
MKHVQFILLLIALNWMIISCTSTKDLPVSYVTNCQGIVHLAENGCPVYIEITNSSVDGIVVGNKLFPVELATNYKKKGLKLSFFATVSRAKSPEGCAIDCVASVGSIQVIP